MSRPIQDTEREEIELLIAECDEDPGRLQRYFFELIRLRNVMQVVRSRSRLNPSIEKSIELNLPPRASQNAWLQMCLSDDEPDLTRQITFQQDFNL